MRQREKQQVSLYISYTAVYRIEAWSLQLRARITLHFAVSIARNSLKQNKKRTA